MPIILKTLTPEDFQNRNYRDILKAVIDLDSRGINIDYITVFQELQNPNISTSYLSGLAESMPTIEYLCDYIVYIKKISDIRKISEAIKNAGLELSENNDIEKTLNDFDTIRNNIKRDVLDEMVDSKDTIEEILKEVNAGKKTGFLTGFNKIDNLLKGFHRGNMITLASGAGKGKTALAINFTANFLMLDNVVCFYSLEQSWQEIQKRLLAFKANVNSNLADFEIDEKKKEQRQKAYEQILKYQLYIDDKPQTIYGLVASAKALSNELKRDKKRLDVVVVDYLQLITESDKPESREREVASFAYGLKNLAKSLDCLVLAVAQTNRNAEIHDGKKVDWSGEKKHQRRYELSDLRESGAIEQASDLVIFLNKVEGDSEYKLDIAKNRHGASFYMNVKFLKSIHKFIECPDDFNPMEAQND